MSSSVPVVDASRCTRLNTLLYVRRFADCVAFYRDGLGLPEAFANAWFVEFTVNPGACLSVVAKGSTRMRDTPFSAQTLTFEVGDADSARAALLARGLAPGTTRRHGFGARVFYLRDPEGNRLEFWSRE